MDTRGVKIIFFRGRYFVYHKNIDSYLGEPGVQGSELVSNIPTNPEHYKEWLENERAFYAALMAELESKVFTVPEDKMEGLAKKETAHYTFFDVGVRPAWKEIDSEFYRVPSAFCDAGNNLMMEEWVYVIDLDNELFSVDNWIFFDLGSIPRDRWIQAFSPPEAGRKGFSFEICPEGSVGTNPPGYFGDDAAGEREKYHAICGQYSRSTVEAISDVKVSSPAALQQIIATMLVENLASPFPARFWKYAPRWGHENFGFRELAFVLLSFAARRFYFDEPERFSDKYESSGYLVDPNEGGKPKLMPLFGSGCHSPDQEPGSAPSVSLYWFDNVLISLVPDTVFGEDTEAAIAKAVEHGLKDGKTNFQAVVFSIFHAIMLEVDVKDGVKTIKHTGVVPIYSPTRAEDDLKREANASNLVNQLCQKHRGFISLQNFFSVAAIRPLSGFGRGRFPTEIYATILAQVDPSTRHACAEVSQTFRILCQDRFPLGDSLTILNFEASSTPPTRFVNPRHSQSWINIDDVGTFAIQDHNTGRIARSGLSVSILKVPKSDDTRLTTWYPVVGAVGRPSMITQLAVRVLAPIRKQDKIS